MKKHLFAIFAAVLALALLLSGCAGSGAETINSTETTGPAAQTQTSSDAADDASSAAKDTGGAGSATVTTLTASDSAQFTARDLTQTADLSEAIAITVSDGETKTITEAGVYVLTGSAENACVVVAAGDDDKVQLVLDGVQIVNLDQPCILVENADKVFLTSAEGSENVLSVSGSFSGDEDAVIFSRDDLVLNGLGTVTVNSSKDGIRTNDDLKLTGGTWIVTASGSAMKAHESISASDGVYVLTAGSDGLHAECSDDDTVGSIVIEGGSFTIRAGDDGIHATTTAAINGGTLTISAAEGIEATQVFLNDGAVSIQATDDGVNAGRKSRSLSVKIEINGGELTIVMGAGDTDAVDSNGDLIITGGTIDISAQSPFDYDGSCSYTGGTIIVNGTQTNAVTNQMMGGGPGGTMGGMNGMSGGNPGGFGGRR